MVKRQIAVGDIHGCFMQAEALVERIIGFDPAEDMLIFMGDYIDRGPQSREVVNYLTLLRDKHPSRIVLLKGNHEDMAYAALSEPEHGAFMSLWQINGGGGTIAEYGDVDAAKEALIPFIESLALFYETDTHIFVHAGIPYGKDLATATPEELLWDRSFSYDGEKTLIVGHSPKSRVAEFNSGKIVCIDTGAYMTGTLSAYDVLNKRVYKTETRVVRV